MWSCLYCCADRRWLSRRKCSFLSLMVDASSECVDECVEELLFTSTIKELQP